MVELRNIIDFASATAVQDNIYVIAGGMTRSGTTYLQRLLSEHPNIWCADEFLEFKGGAFVEDLRHGRGHQLTGAVCFAENIIKSFNGYDDLSDSDQRKMFLISAMATTTSPAEFKKNPSSIQVIACKTPGSEATFLDISRYLAPAKTKYIHCVRDPALVLESNWQMPWIMEADEYKFANYMVDALKTSMIAHRNILASRADTMIFRISEFSDQTSGKMLLARLCAFLELKSSLEMERFVCGYNRVDTWPKPKRRVVPPISRDCMSYFESRSEIKEWRDFYRISITWLDLSQAKVG